MFLISTYSLKWYWLHKIWKILEWSKFDWIDLYMDPNNYDLWDVEYLKDFKNEFWIKILSISTPWATINKAKATIIFNIAKELDVQLVSFSPPFLENTWNSFTKFLKEVKDDYDFNISIQNIENKYILFVIPKNWNIPLNETKDVTWFTSLDVANLDNNSSVDIINAINILWSSLKNVYLSDRKWDKYWLIPWKEKSWISNLPIESFLMKLKSNSYNWFITLKVDPAELWVWNEELMKSNFDRVHSYYNKYYKEFK